MGTITNRSTQNNFNVFLTSHRYLLNLFSAIRAACRAPGKISVSSLCLPLSTFITHSARCFKADCTLLRQLFPAVRQEQWQWFLLPSPPCRWQEKSRTSSPAPQALALPNLTPERGGGATVTPLSTPWDGAALFWSQCCKPRSQQGAYLLIASEKGFHPNISSSLPQLAEAVAPFGFSTRSQREVCHPLLQQTHIGRLGRLRKDRFGTSV